MSICHEGDDRLSHFFGLTQDDALDVGDNAEQHGSGIVHRVYSDCRFAAWSAALFTASIAALCTTWSII